MASEGAVAAVFDLPGGETCGTAPARPIDLTHLSRQTVGDRALEQEVLQLFIRQAVTAAERIDCADAGEAVRLAHGLKGSARGVGAFAIADCVDALEKAPLDQGLRTRLVELVDEARDFISAISR